LRFFESEKELQEKLKDFITAHKSQLGLVSLEAPLISNLPVWSNIALIRQYHQNMSWHEAKATVDRLLQRMGMASIAEKRNPALTKEERFYAMLLRAAMVQDAVLVLDKPFGILTNLRDGHFLMHILHKVDDLIAEAHIFDYSWAKERYGVTADAED
jgi:ABC-type nitrate/sulfonate/bicarbonate transport system ATPase subunit